MSEPPDPAFVEDAANRRQSVSFSATIRCPRYPPAAPGAAGRVPAVIGYGSSSFGDVILGEGVVFIGRAGMDRVAGAVLLAA